MVKKNIGELEVTLGIDAKKSDKALKKTTKGLEKYQKTATKTNTAVKKSFDKSETRIRDFSANAVKLFGAVSAAYAAISVVKGLTDVITKFEKLEASLITVTGSSKAAAKEFKKLQTFAATTPFQLTEVTAAFIKMKALGLDPSEAALGSYGNTASAMGKSLNQMIEAVADAATGEFERLKEFGIKAKQQGDKVTFVFQGISTTVRKNADEISKFLKSIGDVQFAGAMARQADTLNVSLSNMEDSFESLGKAIGDAGVTELFRDIALSITEINKSITTAIKNNSRAREAAGGAIALFVKSIPISKAAAAWRLLNIEQEKSIKLSSKLDPSRLNFPAQEVSAEKTPRPVPRSEKDATAAAEVIQERFEILRQSLLSEEEAEKESRLKRLEDLQDFQEITLDKSIDFNALREQIEEEHQKKLTEIEKQGLTDREKFERMSLQSKAQTIFGELSNITAGVSQHNKTLFEINKVAGIAEAVLNGAVGVSKTLAAYPAPLNFAMAAVHAGVAAAQVAAISSSSFGGGGSVAAPSAGGTAATAGGAAEGGEAVSRSVDINISGLSDDSTMSGKQFREIIAGINEEVGNGAQLRIS